MKQRILTNWKVIRLLRLLVGIAAIIQGIAQSEVVIMLAGVFVSVTAILNYGCCGSTGCPVPSKVKKEIKLKVNDSRNEI